MSAESEHLAALAELIHVHYDLGTIHGPKYMEATHQRRHRKLIIQTELGSFLVKTYKRDPYVLDALRFQHRLSDHLSASGIPVARIQRTREGRGIVEVEAGALELQEFVDGGPMRLTPKTLATAADTLGRFHEACRDVPRPPRDAALWRFSEVPRDSFMRMFELARAEGDEGAVLKACNEIGLFLRDASLALDERARDQFETGLIHGDYHSGNLLYRGETLVAVLDLEYAGAGCFLEDLAYALSNLCLRSMTEPGDLAARVDLALGHYQRHRTLAYSEECALYYAVGIKHITTVSYQLQAAHHELAGYRAPEWMVRLAKQCAWLTSRVRRKG